MNKLTYASLVLVIITGMKIGIAEAVAVGFIALAVLLFSSEHMLWEAYQKSKTKFHLGQEVKWTDPFYGTCTATVQRKQGGQYLVRNIYCSYGAYPYDKRWMNVGSLELNESNKERESP